MSIWFSTVWVHDFIYGENKNSPPAFHSCLWPKVYSKPNTKKTELSGFPLTPKQNLSWTREKQLEFGSLPAHVEVHAVSVRVLIDLRSHEENLEGLFKHRCLSPAHKLRLSKSEKRLRTAYILGHLCIGR